MTAMRFVTVTVSGQLATVYPLCNPFHDEEIVSMQNRGLIIKLHCSHRSNFLVSNYNIRMGEDSF